MAEFEQLCNFAIGNFSDWLLDQIAQPVPGAVSPVPEDNDCFGFMAKISRWVGIYDCGFRNVLSSVEIDPAWCIEIQFDAPRNTNFADNNINLFYQVRGLELSHRSVFDCLRCCFIFRCKIVEVATSSSASPIAT